MYITDLKEILIILPKEKKFISVQKGTGDGCLEETDGGMLLLKEPYEDNSKEYLINNSYELFFDGTIGDYSVI